MMKELEKQAWTFVSDTLPAKAKTIDKKTAIIAGACTIAGVTVALGVTALLKKKKK